MTPGEDIPPVGTTGRAPGAPSLPPQGSPDGDEAERELSELIDAIGGAARVRGSFVYAPNGNVNAGSVHGGQRIHNASVNGGHAPRQGRVREGPIPEAEVRAAEFGFARPEWFDEALRMLERGPLFLAGRAGTGRRTTALNLLRASCGKEAPLRALDSVIELDRWQPTDAFARGYLMDGLFPARPLGPGVLGHVRELLEGVRARMVIVLPDDTDLLRRLEQDLHVTPMMCAPPPPAMVFGSYFEAVVEDRWERERLLSALKGRHDLGDLLAPELVPADVVELVTAIVAADGDPEALGDLEARLGYRAEQEVPDLVARLRGDPEALAFLLAACVFEGLDHRLVREEADRLLTLSQGRLVAMLPGTGVEGDGKTERPNPEFAFRYSLTELLHAVRAVRQERRIHTAGAYAHSVEAIAFVRHRQAEAVLRYVWREYGRLSELLVEWLRQVDPTDEVTAVAGRFMGNAAKWGGGRRALRHIEALAGSERVNSRLIAAKALGIAAQDPVLVAEVRYRLNCWSQAAGSQRRTTVAYACGSEFGISRPDLALRLLRTLLLGVRDRSTGKGMDGDDQVLAAVRVAIMSLFQAGHEAQVFGRLVAWLEEGRCDTDQVLTLFAHVLRSSQWFVRRLAAWDPEATAIVDMTRRALNSGAVFETTRPELLDWAERGQWDDLLRRAVENLFAALAGVMRRGEFRLFVDLQETGTDGWAGQYAARTALARWRSGERWEAA
ncbi:hypothetical protein [Streptomyces rochei]|uniref:hypothetical protein n=1 Tax=Streptomyces rochei TaxID=1928 RepID=UPI0022E99C55|nr:hypothetical protein [Streptomyces rochei]MCC8455096.1 hypothetical protein [Streptomyces rochei]